MREAGEEYLGDGLYASQVDMRGMIKLRAPREGGDHEVYLEREVFIALLDWATRRGLMTTRKT